MKVTFWGTRGSIPVSGPRFVEFGGNTPCLEVDLRSSRDYLVLESGTGIRELGQKILQDTSGRPKTIHLFLTHAHWDHIQGFPFFAPAYVPGFTLEIYCTKDARSFLAGQMTPPFFPVGLEAMRADIRFHQLAPGEVRRVGDATLAHVPLPHPQTSCGFRVQEKTSSFVLATDTEHDPKKLNADLVELARDTDALVYDAQYTPEEYSGKVGWGHSTFVEGVRVAQAAGVKQLILFSHDPTHDDACLREIEMAAKQLFSSTVSARQGTSFEI